jgi:large subunit ribosomal protein L5
LATTLRGDRMYDFIDKLFSITLPRLRDFRGLKLTSFDNQGNYTLGIIDHTVFPEIDLAKVSTPHGMEVTMVTSTKDKEQAKRLLELLGMPFEKED